MKLERVASSNMAMPGQEPDSLGDRRITSVLALSGVFWLIAWYGDTVLSMSALWQSSDAFAHGFLVVSISAWLTWQRRHAVAALDSRPDLRGLPPLTLAGFCWFLGVLAGAGVVQQYALVVMIPLLVWTILGTMIVRALAFPLFFLLFAVPFGDFVEPSLMEHTADFVVFALKLSGIPVYREGQSFMIPSGAWSVVEACSGLRYLTASLTLGVLYAYLMYRSPGRRAIFVALSAIVPIVANWLRAYLIVMIGHLSEMKYAAGFDHLVYGWLFFGVVSLILFWGGLYWREDRDSRPAALHPTPLAARDRPALAATVAAAIAAAGVVAVWPVAAAWLEAGRSNEPLVLQVPPSTADWQPVTGRLTDWTPRFLNSSAQFNQAFGKDGARAGLYVGYYRHQRQGAELITAQNTLAASNNQEWRSTGEVRRTLVFNQIDLSVLETRLLGRSTSLLVWRWYWVDGQYIVNPYWGKLLQAKSNLLGRGDDAAVVIVYARFDDRPEVAEQALRSFVGTMLAAVTRTLEHARNARPAS